MRYVHEKSWAKLFNSSRVISVIGYIFTPRSFNRFGMFTILIGILIENTGQLVFSYLPFSFFFCYWKLQKSNAWQDVPWRGINFLLNSAAACSWLLYLWLPIWLEGIGQDWVRCKSDSLRGRICCGRHQPVEQGHVSGLCQVVRRQKPLKRWPHNAS